MNATLGPWTTAIDSGSAMSLSAFWKQRMEQLPALPGVSPRVSRRGWCWLLLVALLALGWPTTQVSRQVVAGPPTTSENSQPAAAPEAAADEPSQQHGQPLTVNFEQGVRAEIVGLSEHPSQGKTWWAPDGALIDAPYQQLRANASADSQAHKREIAVRWHVPDDAQVQTQWNVKHCWVWASGNASGTESPDIKAGAFAVAEDSKTVTVTLAVAAGEWETVATTNGKFYGSEGKWANGKRAHDFAYMPAIEANGELLLTISHDVLNQDMRIIAVDADGNMIANGSAHGGGSGGFVQTTGIFRNVRRSDIHAFWLQARPYHRVEVRNVALHAGQDTTPEIVDLGLDKNTH